MTIVYAKPAVRNAWADTAVQYNPTTQVGDIFDPGNSFAEGGWLQNTQPPARQIFNWALYWSAAAVRYFMQRGIVDWDTAELYQQNAVVQYGGVVYISIVNSNSGQTPSSAPAYWQQAFSTPAQLAAAVVATETYASAQAAAAQSAAQAFATAADTVVTTNANAYAVAQAATALANAESYTNTAIPAAFGENLVQTGYNIQPNGFIEIWGLSTFTTTGLTVNFSSSGIPGGGFTVACLNVQVTQNYNTSGAFTTVAVEGTPTKTSFVGICTGTPSVTFWRAIGK